VVKVRLLSIIREFLQEFYRSNDNTMIVQINKSRMFLTIEIPIKIFPDRAAIDHHFY
jgi:hypothetical protein